MYGRRQPQYGGGYGQQGRGRSAGSGRFKMMLIIGLAMAGFQVVKYLSTSQVNPVTGENQRVTWSVEEEIQLGLDSRQQMAAQHGGLHPDTKDQDLLDRVGERLAASPWVKKSGYPYEFHLLADPDVVNAFALPGGQCFITAALFSKLENEDQLAGVMGHEIGHVVYRHGAERTAKSNFIQGLIQSVMIGAGGDYSIAQVAQVVGQYANMKYGRDQELESDECGIRLMMEAGYDPVHMIGVMDILEASSGGGKVPEFQSSHPSPDNRREKIRSTIEKYEREGIGSVN